MKENRSQTGLLSEPWFILMVSVATAHQLAQKVFRVSLPWADSYLDPLLLMPILLQLVLWERRVLFAKGPRYTLEWWRVALICLLVSVLAEVAFPVMSPKFTADPYDIVCYGLGAFAFWTVWNKADRSATRAAGDVRCPIGKA